MKFFANDIPYFVGQHLSATPGAYKVFISYVSWMFPIYCKCSVKNVMGTH